MPCKTKPLPALNRFMADERSDLAQSDPSDPLFFCPNCRSPRYIRHCTDAFGERIGGCFCARCGWESPETDPYQDDETLIDLSFNNEEEL